MPNFLNACTNKYDDIQTRHALAYASVCSGISLANADLGIVHGIAVPLGGFFPIPHGIACGTLLSAALRVNVKALKTRDSSNRALKKLTEVGNILFNQKESNNNETIEKLLITLDDWTTNLEMPKLRKYGIRRENIDKIIDNSKNRNNPILLNKNEIREIIEKRV